jgi:hypothetical protein
MVAGVALVLIGAGFFWRQPHQVVGPGLFLAILGAFAVVVGLRYVRSRLEITDAELVSHWGFGVSRIAVSELVDAVVTAPRTRDDSSSGLGAWITPGTNLDIVTLGYLAKWTGHLLSWIGVPASGQSQVLHVLRRVGGPVKIPPITCRTRHLPDDVVAALAAVKHAIERNGRPFRYVPPPVGAPLDGQPPLPPFH